MARLVLRDIRQMEISGLGSHRPFRELSQKRITKAVREALREQYGSDKVEVSCSATCNGGIWAGKCRVNGTSYSYQVMSGLYGSAT